MFTHSITSSGWGVGSGSHNLHQVHLELLSQSDCENILDFNFLDSFNQDVMICAGDVENGERDVCPVGHHYACMHGWQTKLEYFYKFDVNYGTLCLCVCKNHCQI